MHHDIQITVISFAVCGKTFRRRKNSMLFIVVGIIETMHCTLWLCRSLFCSLSICFSFSLFLSYSLSFFLLFLCLALSFVDYCLVWSAFFRLFDGIKLERREKKRIRASNRTQNITLCNVSAHWTWVAACLLSYSQ